MNRRERRTQQSWARRDPRLQGMEVRYGGRTLLLTAYVNTDEEIHAVADRMRRGAPGPKKVMTLVGAKLVDAAVVAPLWAASGIGVLFGGRTLSFDVYVNTDETLEVVSARLLAAASTTESEATIAVLRKVATDGGQADFTHFRLAVVIGGGDVERELSDPMWKATFNAMEKTVENEN